MSKSKKIFAAVTACVAAVAIGAVSLGAVGTGGKKEIAAEEVDTRILIETATPQKGDIVIQGEFIGTVDPNRTVTVFPKAAGEVLTVNYDVGDVVEAGAVLCELDSKTLRTTITQTKAALASAQAKANYNLAVAKNDLETAEFNSEHGYEANLNSAKAGVTSAEKAVENAKNQLRGALISQSTARQNLKDLRDSENEFVVITASFDQTEREYLDRLRQTEIAVETAEIAVENAENGLKQAKESVKTLGVMSEEQRISAADRVKMAELNADLSDQYITIQKLEDDLANYTVTAAISGVVEQRNIDPFDMASQQTPLFVIANKDAMTVSFNVSESSLANMRIGDVISVDKSGKQCTGIITSIASSVDARSGLFTVEATVENPPEGLYSGSTVKVFANTQEAKNNLLVPIDAIYHEGGKPFVYVARDGAAYKVFIETGISNEENIQILSGLTANDEVVITWNPGLADGVSIKLGAEGE